MSRVDDALLLRDTIQRIVDDKLGKERPKSSYALVTGFNPDEGTVSVIFDGDDISVDIPAGSIYPSEVGQTVRVGGSSGAKVIEDVMGENLTEVKAREAQETADGKNTVHYGETRPEGTDHKEGDLWFDESNSNMPHTWINGEWVSIEDQRVAAIAEAQEELKQELDTVMENGVGTKTFYKPTQPTAAESSEGDLWFNTSEGGNNELHTYVNGQWVSAADARIAAIQQAQAELASDLEDAVTNGLGTKTFYKPTQPAVADSKEGDIWFDTSTAGKNALHVFTGGAWVSAADARLAELKDAQAEMEGDISAAQQRADEAFQDAADADSKAATAQSTANTAKSDAATAAGIAGGKADVLIQSTTPATDMRKATTLWIDTTGSANTPKRWNGTAWVVVTDKAATDAASAAATAQTKADEAKFAADAAQTTATNAQTAASNAQSTATEALTSANSKNTVTRSTANPTTPYAGRVDDIWWKMSTLSSGGRVIAQYRWSGTAWLTETIDNAVIANLDAAKITTGYLAAARIKANTLNADTVLVNGSLGSIILRDGAITTPKIAVGAITAESGVVASLDAGKITVGILDSARIAAGSISADQVLIGLSQNMIPDPSFSNTTINAARISRSAGYGGTWSIADGMATYNPSGQTANASMTFAASNDLYSWPAYAGMPIVMRVQAKARSGSSSFRMTIYVKKRSGTGYYSMVPSSFTTLTTGWKEYVATYTMPEDAVGYSTAVQIPSGATGIVDFQAPYASASVGSTLIEPGAITTEKIAVGAITAQSGIIASLDAGKITVGTLDSARIAANSITADKVLIGSGSNLLVNPRFDNNAEGTSTGLTFGGTNGKEDAPYVSTAAASGQSGGYIGATSGSDSRYRAKVSPGMSYRVSAWARANADIPVAKAAIYIRFFTGTDLATASWTWGTPGNVGNDTVIPANTWGEVTGIITAPAGAVEASIGLYSQSGFASSIDFCQPVMQQASGSTLILPGSITTEKLAVGAITAESGVIGSLDASKITVGKLSGARLEADAINGMQIIGATIATSTGFPRTQMDASGISAYSSSSVRTFFADASTGEVSLIGKLFTGRSGFSRVEIDPTLWSSMPVYNDDGTVAGYANGAGVRVGTDASNSMDMYHAGVSGSVRSGVIRGPGGVAKIVLNGGGVIFSGETSSGNVTSDFVGRFRSLVKKTTDENQYSLIEESSSRVLIGTYGTGNISSEISNAQGYSRINSTYQGKYSSLTASSGDVTLKTYYGGYDTSVVRLVGSDAANSTYVDISAENIRPLNVTYNGTGASWLIPFKKGTTDWGYIGSTGAMSVDDFGIQSASGKRLFLSAAGSATNITMESNGNMELNVPTSASGSPRLKALPVWNVTSSSGSAVRVNSSGTLFNDGSSERYKQDIEDAPKLTSILDVQPRMWRERWAVKASEELAEFREDVIGPVPIELADAPEEAPWYYGAIAEEIHALGLTQFVQYDAFGRPDGLYYDRMSVALIPFIKELLARVAALEALSDTPTGTAPVD